LKYFENNEKMTSQSASHDSIPEEELIQKAVQEELSSLEKEPSAEAWTYLLDRLNFSEEGRLESLEGDHEKNSSVEEGREKNKKAYSRFRFRYGASIAAALLILLFGGLYLSGEGMFWSDETAEIVEDEAEESMDGMALEEADEPIALEKPTSEAKIPAVIGDMEYQETLKEASTEHLLYLKYASAHEEMKLVKASPPALDQETLLERLQEDWKEEIKPDDSLEELEEVEFFQDSQNRPLLLWKGIDYSGNKTLWVIWPTDQRIDLEQLQHYYFNLAETITTQAVKDN